MKHFNFLFSFLLFIIFFSCQNEINENRILQPSEMKLESKVLSERESAYPFSLEREKKKDTRALPPLDDNATIISFLGRGYKSKEVPIESPYNLGYRVIDINKLNKETNYIYKDLINKSDESSLAFSSFDSDKLENYSQSKLTINANAGFGGFSATYKSEYEKKFTSIVEKEKACVYGEGSIIYRATKFYIQSNSANIKRKIIRNYIDSLFIEELYHQNLQSTINEYGSGILKSFVSGGRITTMYRGVYEKEYNKTIMEEILKTSIGASYKSNAGSGGGSIDTENASKETQEDMKKFSNMQVTARSLGGLPLGNAISATQDLFSFKLNTENWAKSLADKQTHSIAEIPESSIEPIYEFIEEENFKQIIKYKINGIDGLRENSPITNASFEEPCINIILVSTHVGEEAFTNQQPLSDWITGEAQDYIQSLYAVDYIRLTATAFLTGRHGTMINIGNIKYIENVNLNSDNNTSVKIETLIKDATTAIKKDFGLKIVLLSDWGLPETALKSCYLNMFVTPNYDDYYLPNFTEKIKGKMIDRNKNLMYILYEDENSKFALSFFNSAQSINNYAFKFINNINTIPFDSNILENYRIIGL